MVATEEMSLPSVCMVATVVAPHLVGKAGMFYPEGGMMPEAGMY